MYTYADIYLYVRVYIYIHTYTYTYTYTYIYGICPMSPYDLPFEKSWQCGTVFSVPAQPCLGGLIILLLRSPGEEMCSLHVFGCTVD